ncbi:MAG: hypothetical protein K1Y01_08035 [Vicinamibacteria bacterium]|nr:hypothetical protein [Vicinamibacteria bacterium]
MAWIIANIKWIMLVSGTLTFTMIYAAIDPEGALRSNFGETLSGPLALLLTRNWGALIALVGAMLVYGAFDAGSRRLALSVAGLSKTVFILLVLSNGNRFLAHQAGVAVVVDSLMVLVFLAYLLKGPRRA